MVSLWKHLPFAYDRSHKKEGYDSQKSIATFNRILWMYQKKLVENGGEFARRF